VKRFATILTGTAAFVALAATQAMAQQLYPPAKPPGPEANPGPPAFAFTGGNIAFGILVLVALVVVGTALLMAGRRRRGAVVAKQS
jgi:hypothetical protein